LQNLSAFVAARISNRSDAFLPVTCSSQIQREQIQTGHSITRPLLRSAKFKSPHTAAQHKSYADLYADLVDKQQPALGCSLEDVRVADHIQNALCVNTPLSGRPAANSCMQYQARKLRPDCIPCLCSHARFLELPGSCCPKECS
jgi:hypothetical protein